MNDAQETVEDGKAEWSPPRLVELHVTMDQIENGIKGGSDGHGGFNTSAS